MGVPALYIHSLTATRNYTAGVEESGRARTINRRKWNEDELNALLADRHSAASQVMSACRHRLQLRAQHKTFHPDAAQQIINIGPEWFVVARERDGERVFCISNFTDEYRELKIDDRLYRLNRCGICSDILSGNRFMGDGKVIAFAPYQTVWLQV